MKDTCIICRKEYEEALLTSEHIIPDSLGGAITIKKVCKQCNSLLGSKIDIALTNNYICGTYRYLLGLKGKKGNIPSPFPSSVLTDDPEQKIIFNGTEPSLIPKKTTNEEGEICITCNSDTEADKMVEKILKRHGIDTSNRQEIESRVTKRKEITEKPKFSFSVDINIGGMAIAVTKIGYEIAYYLLGNTYLKDKRGMKITDMILEYADCKVYKDEYDHLVASWGPEESFNSFVSKLQQYYKIDYKYHHFILLDRIAGTNQLGCLVSLFGKLNYTIVVSDTADMYSSGLFPYFIFQDPSSGKYKQYALKGNTRKEK